MSLVQPPTREALLVHCFGTHLRRKRWGEGGGIYACVIQVDARMYAERCRLASSIDEMAILHCARGGQGVL